jgi:hypothetical protein
VSAMPSDAMPSDGMPAEGTPVRRPALVPSHFESGKPSGTATARPRSTVALPDGSATRAAKRLAPERAKKTAKSMLRGIGVATSPLRGTPDVLLIGAKRTGSTSLHNYLLQHPTVAPLFPRAAHVKGAHYFDRNAWRPESWYRSFGPMRVPGRHRTSVDGSPYYLIHPTAAAASAAAVPHAKVIVLLREPAQRALSHYWDEVKLGHEPLSFEDALAAEPSRLAGEVDRIKADPHYWSLAHEHLSYRLWGQYAEHLAPWIDAYGRDRILVLRSEDLFADPASTFRRVTDFLELDAYAPPFKRFNAAPRAGDVDPVVRQLRDSYRDANAELGELVGMPDLWT